MATKTADATNVDKPRGIPLQKEGILLMRIARKFRNIKQVKALGRILLRDDGRFVQSQIVDGAVPAVTTVADDVLQRWKTKFPLEAFGGRLLEALSDDLVDAEDIAKEFAGQLVPQARKC